MPRTVIAGALGNCVHVAGVAGFLRVADRCGFETHYLGAATSIDRFVEAIRLHDPEIVGVSYRLTPEVAGRLLVELRERLAREDLLNRRFVFGGTPPVCEVAESLDWFERCFTGLERPDAVWSYLTGATSSEELEAPADTLVERLERSAPYPLLRHHFGLPDLDDTVQGIERIAEADVLDVISIAPDQNAQESFFRPEEMDPALDGAGGVCIRSANDLHSIYEASRRGSHPLLRIYSGTRDLLEWAELATRTVHNAWAAIPLCWYNALDGRSDRGVEDAIREDQRAMRWYAEHDIPVEVNEPHHWSLREAHDAISVAAAYLAAYNAKASGVRNYVSQYMFNTPPGMSGAMDLAKMLAQIEVVESLHDREFRSFRQVRAGLLHLCPRLNRAKGQLAASTMLALAVRPHIIHVVGYCEGDHAALADDVIESCEIVHGVMANALHDMPDSASDPAVIERKRQLVREARAILDAMRGLAPEQEDALTDPAAISRAIRMGILDAPHLKGNPHAAGILKTRLINGAMHAVDEQGLPLAEEARLAALREPAAV